MLTTLCQTPAGTTTAQSALSSCVSSTESSRAPNSTRASPCSRRRNWSLSGWTSRPISPPGGIDITVTCICPPVYRTVRNVSLASVADSMSLTQPSAIALLRVLVGDREGLVEDRDALVELVAGDRERRADHDDIPVRHEVEPAVERRLRRPRDRRERLARRVERDERLARLAVLDQLEPPEAAQAAYLADRRVTGGEPLERLAPYRPELGRVLDDAFLLEGLDRRHRRGARQRVAAVGEPAREVLVLHPVGDRLPDDHGAEGHIARVDALGDREDVGHDIPVVHAEPLAGAAEPGHHFVADEQDPVPVADLADRLQVAVRRDDDPVRPDDRLHDHGGDRLGPLVLEDLLEVRRAGADRARIGVAGRASVGIRVEHPHDARDPGLGLPPPRVAGKRDRAAGRPVVGAVARDDLVPARVPAGELDRVLV